MYLRRLSLFSGLFVHVFHSGVGCGDVGCGGGGGVCVGGYDHIPIVVYSSLAVPFSCNSRNTYSAINSLQILNSL